MLVLLGQSGLSKVAAYDNKIKLTVGCIKWHPTPGTRQPNLGVRRPVSLSRQVEVRQVQDSHGVLPRAIDVLGFSLEKSYISLRKVTGWQASPLHVLSNDIVHHSQFSCGNPKISHLE